MGMVAHLLKRVPAVAPYKGELEQMEAEIERLRKENLELKIALAEADEKIAEPQHARKP